MRDLGETNSIRVRRAVSYAFSGGSFNALQTYLVKKHVSCESTGPGSDDKPTRIHFVPRDSRDIEIMPEVINGIWSMGFADATGGIPESIEQVYARLNGGGWGMGIGMTESPVDYDFGAKFEALKGKVTVSLVHSAGGGEPSNNIELKCKIVN